MGAFIIIFCWLVGLIGISIGATLHYASKGDYGIASICFLLLLIFTLIFSILFGDAITKADKECTVKYGGKE